MSEEKTTVEKTVDLELTVPDRFKILSFIPEKGDILPMLIALDLKEQFELGLEELKSIDFATEAQGENTIYKWNNDKAAKLTKVFKLSESQLKVLKDRITALGKEDKIVLDNVRLAHRIQDLQVKGS